MADDCFAVGSPQSLGYQRWDQRAHLEGSGVAQGRIGKPVVLWMLFGRAGRFLHEYHRGCC